MRQIDYLEFIRLSEINSLLNYAEHLTLDTVAIKNVEPTYPITPGEKIINYTLHIVLTNGWEDTDDDIILKLQDILSQLDMGVDQPELWKSLFTINDDLRKHLEARWPTK